MGGNGSGRHFNSKETTSDYPQLDVRCWQRDGLLTAGRTFFWCWWKVQVCASLNALGTPERVLLSPHIQVGREHSFLLAWTNFCGGLRAWFQCACGRRCAILYDGGRLACRQCHDLAYDSQQKSDRSRGLHKAQAIRTKLGGSGSLADEFPKRPKHMHRSTYMRLFTEAGLREGVLMESWLASPRRASESVSKQELNNRKESYGRKI